MNNTYRRNWFLAFCVLPSFVLFSIFILYPAFKIFIMSLYNWTGIGDGAVFVGLQNFKELFKDEVMLIATKNTIFLMLAVPAPTLLLALFFAAALSKGGLKERNFYRTVFFFPSVLSFVVIAILWSFMYHPTMGIINSILNAIGLENLALPWLGNRKTVMWAIAVTLIWQAVGYYMVMYIAGMDNISDEIYEAAQIDGATAFQQFWSITLPLLWEIVRITIIFSMSGVITISFTIVNVMTAGGPDRYSEVVLTQMYSQAFMNSNFGYAMAIAVCVFIVSIILSLISNKLTDKEAS